MKKTYKITKTERDCGKGDFEVVIESNLTLTEAAINIANYNSGQFTTYSIEEE